MKKIDSLLVSLTLVAAFAIGGMAHQPLMASDGVQAHAPNIAIVWTSGDRDVALKMVFMYTLNAKSREWANEVELIVWGPSSKLLSHDAELQDQVEAMRDAGVVLKACKACADSYGVTDDLLALGVEVKYMGVELTERVASDDWHTITF